MDYWRVVFGWLPGPVLRVLESSRPFQSAEGNLAMPPPNPQIDAHSDTARQRVSPQLKISAVALRSVFLITLVVLAVRVSLPQSEKIWTIYDEPRDAVRLILGFVVSVWIVYHLFRLPRDEQGYRIWAHLGIILVPLTLATLFAFW